MPFRRGGRPRPRNACDEPRPPLAGRLLRELLFCEECQENKDHKNDECSNEQEFRDARTSRGDVGEPEDPRYD
jgi:hypothetical protein